MMISKNGYAIVSPKGEIQIYSVRDYRKDTIHDWCFDSSLTWKEMRKIGWVCRKVQVAILF